MNVNLHSVRLCSFLRHIVPYLLLTILTISLSPALHAASWDVLVGAQSHDKGSQSLAFFPNELWVHVGDSVTWHFQTDEIHTVTFLKIGQARPSFQEGCPGTTSDNFLYHGDGSSTGDCVNSGTKATGDSYTVTFLTTGNFSYVCLVHTYMTGTIHVLDSSEPLPYDQSYYDRQAQKQGSDLKADGAGLKGDAQSEAKQNAANETTAGIGEIGATGGGFVSISLQRFFPSTIVIRAGQTVEWTNHDPSTPHTITFGPDPGNTVPSSPGVTVDSDGARHATINSPSDSLHSGFIGVEPPAGTTRFRVTFVNPGLYQYHCALHDDLGMEGVVRVLP